MKRGTKRMRGKSAKREGFDRDTYRPFKAAYVAAHPRCEISVASICTASVVDLHHLFTQARSGGCLPCKVDPENVAATCRACHNYVEGNRAWGLAAGWLRRQSATHDAGHP